MKLNNKNLSMIILSVFCLFLGMTYWETVVNVFFKILNAATPLIVGLAVAYILNILMSFYERHYFPKHQHLKAVIKTRRVVCMLAAIITFAGVLTVLIWLVIPELISCIKLLVSSIPQTIDKILSNEYIKKILPENMLDFLYGINWKEQITKNAKILTSGIGDAATTIFSAVSSISTSVVTTVIGIIFSVYLLLSKEKLINQSKRMLNAFLPEKIYNKLFYVLGLLNDSFHKYVVGQCTEAVILGSLCMIGMAIFKLPYAVMIGTLVGFTALIPVAGACIGTVIGAIMIFTVSPMKAVLFVIFICVLQQIEGNLIYPKVVGKSIGLPAILVLSAITLGGRLMGIGGMLIAVPIVSTIHTLLREVINKREMKSCAKQQVTENT